jgi:transcriptional regulator with PAS, ATPase and Fis domain
MERSTNTGQEFRETVTAYLSSLSARRDFAGVIRYYEDNRSLIDEAGGIWAGSILLQVARACASLTDYPVALKYARRAQALTASGGDTGELAEVFIVLGEILRDMGQVKEARKALHDAESIFRRNDHLEGQSRALNLMAGLFFRQADYRNSLRMLLDAVEIARKLNDKRKLAFMMGNIGRIHTFTGDLAEAEKHLELNIDLSKELQDQLETARALLSLAYVYIQQAAYDRAERVLDEAYPLIIAEKSRRDEAIYFSYVGELLYRDGRLDEARTALEKGLALAEDIASGSTLAGRILRHLAELSLREKNYRQAQRMAARAMVIMENAGNKVETGALLRIKAQIALAQAKANEARKLFHRSIDMLDESGVRFEKVETFVAAGRADCFDQRQRMTYLFRAEEFYSRNRITSRLNRVGRLISSLSSLPLRQNTKRPDIKPGTDYLTISPEIQRFKKQLPMLAQTDLPILLTGETGVGKDHLARYFHSLVRAGKPFVAINCASVPETLLESELFGYHRGAFTGADANKQGLFMAANGGVLFLDEIGDMPLSLQSKLLGVLERRSVIPLGSTREVDLDIILVAATNRDLEAMVEEGGFRRDLYYRLSGVTFHLQPLRDRREDVPILLREFMRRYGLLAESDRPPTELVRQFLEYDWPGNIRELDNKVKRLQVMSDMVAEGDLAEICRPLFPDRSMDEDAEAGSLFEQVEQFERRLLTQALLAAEGNKSEAARMLGVHEATVRTKLKRYGISLVSGEAEDRAVN